MSDSSSVEFFKKINTHLPTRIKFLANPVEALEGHGISLTDDLKAQVTGLVDQVMEHYPSIALLPIGFDKSGPIVSSLLSDAGADAGAGDAGAGDAGTGGGGGGGGSPPPKSSTTIIL
ncbi:MAG: hypothetical protein PW843_28485 [Azospirillaceae bacterium]|nr:hypothetical protein [Azospirillaceae bacterium]